MQEHSILHRCQQQALRTTDERAVGTKANIHRQMFLSLIHIYVGVSKYIKELSDKLKDERIMSAKDRQVALSDIAKSAEQDPSDRIRALDTLNKMTGESVSYTQLEI